MTNRSWGGTAAVEVAKGVRASFVGTRGAGRQIGCGGGQLCCESCHGGRVAIGRCRGAGAP